MLSDLERDPKACGEKKQGPLASMRAYRLRYRGDQWRAVYIVNETERLVTILSFDKHDAAYRDAERR